ncbi:phosphonate metabolism transcriptional regulator PhnF [Mameliella sediminis]|uniref:phosphonate metabolism transcriptional regulator PhnF n=1 Tax=Mameliella sediminis TaxID=2836866 RepID=UPI001C45D385|nr:phosphonate metabolism transcriptional regulator PhnF [Mameliella sediminis]MBY6113387.1 phosphonate metabolism transcriptional regulator PhnF [Antarctobacter heliothermus]MBY6143265.1 phosphonate metabolism transcriptional regulator PhnF [Mameliella alba]MBV7394685.1 phosphonate metabolism transcriptional regulator PhnF [Mameliella sediminis]MBY6163134.1 phosphonate metabolism transcriptional regulator PhnF [Mameliella alba]MBY6171398.1 phosphonate metabolism transcriptional regulator PhnF
MPRPALWTAISDNLTRDIAAGRYRPGDKLPTEAELSARFGVNRHTVRRALQAMSDGGLVHSRRGAGVFVAATPTDYPLGRRVRFNQNLRAAGRVPGREILMSETRSADPGEARALAIDPGDPVHVYETLATADGVPIALGAGVFPARRIPNFLEALHSTDTVTDALAACGIMDYTRASTRVTALLATPTQAVRLRLAEGAPILKTSSVNIDPDGVAIEYGETLFAGDRVALTLEA